MEIPQELKELSKRDLIRLILSQIEQITDLQRLVEELERRLLAYENAHTPPSKDKRKYPKREKSNNKVGAPEGHKGATRPIPKPNRFEKLEIKECPYCNKRLGRPIKISKRIIEDIPEPQPLIITEFTVNHYFCNHCNKEVIPTHQDLPEKGRLGYNLQSEITLMKYQDRLPHRKIADTLNRQYGLNLTPATILDVTRRVADKLQETYKAIKERVKASKVVNADETGIKVRGKNLWTWVFITLTDVLFLIRKSRGQGPIKEALGNYTGLLGCDGWSSYPKCVKKLQRCWTHLLREAKWYAEKYEGQVRLLYSRLCYLFERIKKITINTTQSVRTRTYNYCLKELKSWINTCKAYKELKGFIDKIKRGLGYWLTCVLHPEIEPTNNKAERALREIVIQRKISSLWNEKGIRIKETVMSVLATWNLNGLNIFSMLRKTLSS